MNKQGVSARRAGGWLDWAKIFFLYREAFPENERKPLRIIAAMQKKGRSDVWCFEKDGHFAGFASTVNANGLVMIDYLAVCRARRGQGIGSAALDVLKQMYADTGIFVEIESVYEDADNVPERLRRKKFYTEKGLVGMNVMADVFGVKMELLAWNCRVDFEAYQALYREYNPWAVSHIIRAEHPDGEKIDK